MGTKFTVRCIACLIGLNAAQFAVAQSHGEIELLRDPHFQGGLAVLHIDPPDVPLSPNDPFNGDWVAGVLQPNAYSGNPVWRACQWYSHFDLATAPREKTRQGGVVRFFDGGKTATFGPIGSESADLKLRLNGRTEWRNESPAMVGAWPHLLVQQRIDGAPHLSVLETLRLQIRYRLNLLDLHRDRNWNDQRQAAKFSIFVTLQNVDERSPEHGDYLWFGIPLFDSRYDIPKRFVARDRGNAQKRGTNKFIFTAGGSPFGVKEYAVGVWEAVDCDILSLVKTALKAAWAAGYLTDREDLRSYSLGVINLGWEISGPVDAEMQVRDLSLTYQSNVNQTK